jgi:hypothetical protein
MQTREGRDFVVRRLILAAVALAPLSAANAAEMDGVSLPETQMADGTQMQLNGIGVRTFSIFGIRIYVAGLYLEQRNDNSDSILRSSEKKLLDIRFLHDVDAAHAREAWQDGFAKNCLAPCDLDPRDVQRFLAAIPPMHKGDTSTLLFTSKGVKITLNGRPIGEINDRPFAAAVLATFIGPEPPTHRLKSELLGLRE